MENHKHVLLYVSCDPYAVASLLKIIIPVDTATIIVAEVNYTLVSMSIPTVSMWWAHAANPNRPIASIAKLHFYH
jgi:hypothetical protein